MKNKVLVILLLLLSTSLFAQQTKGKYLNNVIAELQKEWPKNRTVNLVFHGHSVPSGYFFARQVNTLGSYPQYTLEGVKEKYPYAVVNSIITAIGGENAIQGQKRFESDVLCMRPDVVFIDYALNDRYSDFEEVTKAWEQMVVSALKYGTKVVLLTPTPDTNEDILDENAPLNKHSHMIKDLAKKYDVEVTDSYELFKNLARQSKDTSKYMSQNNHPNEKGHQLVAKEIFKLF